MRAVRADNVRVRQVIVLALVLFHAVKMPTISAARHARTVSPQVAHAVVFHRSSLATFPRYDPHRHDAPACFAR